MITPFDPSELPGKSRQEVVDAYKAMGFTDDEAVAFTDVLLGDAVAKSVMVTTAHARTVADKLGNAEFTKAVEQAEKLELSEVIVKQDVDGTISLVQPTGVMVGWFVPEDYYLTFDVQGGVQDQHITFCELGLASDLSVEDQRTLIAVTSEVASRHTAFDAILGNTEVFEPSHAWVALAAGAQLLAFREDLATSLKGVGLSVFENYEYQPHMTLAFLPPNAEAPAVEFAPTQVHINKVTVAIAGLHFGIPIPEKPYDGTPTPDLVPYNEQVRSPFRPIVKSMDEEKRFTLAPVYVPMQKDAHGDWATPDDLQDAMWDFVRGEKQIAIQHNKALVGHGEVVENMTIPWEHTVDMPNDDGTFRKVTFPAGTPWLGVVWDEASWPLVKTGIVRGYSIGGRAVMTDEDVAAITKYNHNHDPASGQFAGGDSMGDFSDEASSLSEPDGGFTVRPSGQKVTSGYAVSPYPKQSQMINNVKSHSTADLQKQITEYRDNNKALLSKPGHVLGGWHDPETGKAYLDVSIIAKTPAEATKIALENDQIAYFDLGKGESVDVNRDAKSGQA